MKTLSRFAIAGFASAVVTAAALAGPGVQFWQNANKKAAQPQTQTTTATPTQAQAPATPAAAMSCCQAKGCTAQCACMGKG
ncbi:MAG TPA: hypothetical protein VG672_24470 [Bryobacteraceae bacterium]|nr:hypothetical protein [Bryobacteraceae bacterium]